MAKKTNDKKITVKNQIPTDFVGTDAEKAMAKKLCSIPGGQFARIRYMSSVPVNASYKRQGYTLQKMTDTTTRTGVQYGNIAGVVLSDGPAKVNNFEWVDGAHNRIKRNTKTGKYYAVVAPISKGNNTKSTFILTDPTGATRSITREEAREYAIPSYWNKNGDGPKVMTIELGNIKRIK